jgi:hypothetical protein
VNHGVMPHAAAVMPGSAARADADATASNNGAASPGDGPRSRGVRIVQLNARQEFGRDWRRAARVRATAHPLPAWPWAARRPDKRRKLASSIRQAWFQAWKRRQREINSHLFVGKGTVQLRHTLTESDGDGCHALDLGSAPRSPRTRPPTARSHPERQPLVHGCGTDGGERDAPEGLCLLAPLGQWFGCDPQLPDSTTARHHSLAARDTLRDHHQPGQSAWAR